MMTVQVSNLKIKWRMRTCVQASMQHAQMNTHNQSFSLLRSRAHAFYQQHFSHVSSHMCPFICPYMLSSYVSLYVSAFYQQHTQKHARAYTATYQRHPQKHARTHARTHVRTHARTCARAHTQTATYQRHLHYWRDQFSRISNLAWMIRQSFLKVYSKQNFP